MPHASNTPSLLSSIDINLSDSTVILSNPERIAAEALLNISVLSRADTTTSLSS